MKKYFFVLIILCCFLPLFSSFQLGFSTDAGLIQDFVVKNSSYNFCADIRAKVTQEFEARLPVGIVWKKNTNMIDAGLSLVYYPFENLGLFAGLTLIQFGFVRPTNLLSKNTISLNEVILGWTFNFRSGIFIEPSVSIRDPSKTFSDEYSLIKGAFPCYKSFRAHLAFGYKFNIGQ